MKYYNPARVTRPQRGALAACVRVDVCERACVLVFVTAVTLLGRPGGVK